MSDVTGWLNRAGLRIMAWIGAACMACLTVAVWVYTVKRSTVGDVRIEWDSLGANMLYFLLLAVAAYGICRGGGLLGRLRMHVLEALLAVGVTGGLLFLIAEASAVQPVADQAMVLFGAEWLLDGNYEEIYNNSYFAAYPHQLQLSKFFAGILYMSGRSVWESLQFLQCVNAVCAGLTFYAGARVAGELFGDARVEGLYLLLAIPFAPMYIYVLFLYGETIGLCGAVWAIYFFLLLNRERAGSKGCMALWWIGMALSLWVAYLMRTALIIVGIAIVIVQVLIGLRRQKWKPTLYAALALGCVLGGQRLYGYSVERDTGIALDQGVPAILWVTMGMQGGEEVADQPGSYNGYNLDTFTQCGYDAEAASEQAWEELGIRLGEWRENPGGMFRFLKSKLLNQWAEPSYSAFSSTRMLSEPAEWVNDCWYGEKHVRVYDGLNLYQSAAYLLILIYFCRLAAVRDEERKYLPGLILIGGVLFSVIWEAQSRYIYPYIVFMMPCMAAGLLYCLDGAEAVFRKVRAGG